MRRIVWMLLAVAVAVPLLKVGLDAYRDGRDYEKASAALQAALQPDPDEFLRRVRTHLQQQRTDVQLLHTGNALCGELDRSDGDVRALAADIGAGGPTDPDAFDVYSHDMTVITDTSIKWLCPRWIDAYLDEFPTSAPTV